MRKDYDVAVVGYGPVGAILANLLGRAGHTVLVVERSADVYDKPRAISIDHEVMRVLQSIDLADRILPGTIEHPGTDFLGVKGEVIRMFEPITAPYPLYWPPNLMFIQPEFEPAIREGVSEYPTVDVRLSTECTALTDVGDQVRLSLKGTDSTHEVSAKFVVACDGAASSVRKSLGIGHESLDFDEHWTVVDAWLLRDTPLPRRTTQYCRPDGPATYVVGPRNLRRWEIKLMPGETPDDLKDPAYLKRRLSAYVDPDAIDIWRVATYHFHALVAEDWRRGRIFLAGDAAHQMPPFMAQGFCSGVRDVANLAWKLTGVLNGDYAANLLDTYELERKPHIRSLTATTKEIGQIIGQLDIAAAVRRDEEMIARLRSGGAVSVRQALIPCLTTGLIGRDEKGGSAPKAGELFPQPRVRSRGDASRLLDDVVRNRFLILTRAGSAEPPSLAQLPAKNAIHLQLVDRPGGGLALSEIVDLDGTLSRWMDDAKLQSVIVRPDRYVFGAARTSDEFVSLLSQLRTDVPFTSSI